MPVKDCVPKSKLGNCPEPAFGKFQTHIRHTPACPDPAGELEFDGQLAQVCAVVALITLLYLPGAHRVHVDTAVTLLYLPEPHAVHVADPVASLYVPAAHAVHEPPSGPEKPTLHVHCVNVVLETGEYELPGQARHPTLPAPGEYLPSGQSRQALLPNLSLYFPATQALQTCPLGPV